MCKRLAIIFALIIAPSAVRADVTLMMAEEPGCIWCARWNAEIAPIYPKTDEGKAAPLRRVDVTGTIPDDIQLVRRINFTPTFVLLINGSEVSRIEGYPGEDFFWGLLGVMLEKQNIPYTLVSGG